MATGATTEQTVIAVGREVVLAYNRKDWGAARAVMAPGYVYDETATLRRVQGADEVLAVWRGWATAFPDSEGDIHNTFLSDDTTVIELTWRGTHSGPLHTAGGTIEATGKRIELRACQITTVRNGKAETTRHYFDMTTLMRQLGVTS
jgi:steroid delta-isomerase-like uncharacterized protein